MEKFVTYFGEPWRPPKKVGDKFLLCVGRTVEEIFVTYFGEPWRPPKTIGDSLFICADGL